MQIQTITQQQVHAWLPKRQPDAHKGSFGRILLLCGAVGYTGAPVLAARAALRSGAGLVFLGVPEPIYPIVAAHLIEPVFFPLPAESGMLSEQAIPAIVERLAQCDACLIGCGLGRSAGTAAVVQAVLHHAQCPVVVDADGINVLAAHIDILRGTACPVILTPHEGEFGCLGGDRSLPRLRGTCQLQAQTGAILLRKGPRSLICDAERCYINRSGNPGMATGGSGDALSGLIVSLLGQGLPPLRAAAAAAWLHGTAGDLCAKRMGEYALLPTDLIEALPRLLK